MKGSVASRRTNERRLEPLGAAHTWDEQYTLRPLWWKGPYDIAPIMQHINPGAAVLDVGCGTGRYLVPLDRAGFAVVGIDLSQTALRLLAPHLVRIVADMQKLPLVDQSFDALTCYGVLQHLREEERANAVIELFRVLKYGGMAFVEVVGVHDMRYGSGVQEEEGTFTRQGIRCHYFSSLELSQLFITSGFTVLELKNRLAKKCYRGVERTRHRISLISQRL
ncbi:MAG: class I SAM-dependent methyltransferase [Euryarchaeota archaeon]|nr:class I SAM-dependent methyltransferase [Euryarchaeota archaeon]